MAKRKGIKEGRYIRLNEIRVFGDTMTRQVLVKAVDKKGFEKAMADPQFQMQELADSMRAVGQIECVGVRPIECEPELLAEDGLTGLYQLIYGLRRFFAARMLGWTTIKAVVLH